MGNGERSAASNNGEHQRPSQYFYLTVVSFVRQVYDKRDETFVENEKRTDGRTEVVAVVQSRDEDEDDNERRRR